MVSVVFVCGSSFNPNNLGLLRFLNQSYFQWVFRRCRDVRMREVIQMIENYRLTEDRTAKDVVLWRQNETEFRDFFSTSAIWNQLCMHKPATAWSKVIWLSHGGVPQFSFITWLAIRNRLSTRDYCTWGLA